MQKTLFICLLLLCAAVSASAQTFYIRKQSSGEWTPPAPPNVCLTNCGSSSCSCGAGPQTSYTYFYSSVAASSVGTKSTNLYRAIWSVPCVTVTGSICAYSGSNSSSGAYSIVGTATVVVEPDLAWVNPPASLVSSSIDLNVYINITTGGVSYTIRNSTSSTSTPISGSTLNSASYTSGTYIVTATKAFGNGSFSTSFTIQISNPPDAGRDRTYCKSTGSIDLSTWGPSLSQGSWSGVSGIANGFLNVSGLAAGQYTLRYTRTSDGLSDTIILILTESVGGVAVLQPANNCTQASGSVTLTGRDGNILFWEKSSDATNWVKIKNAQGQDETGQTINYTTSGKAWYRASVAKGECPAVYSQAAEVKPLSGGILSTSSLQQTCGQVSGTLVLSEAEGILTWERDTDNNWTQITTATSPYNFTVTTATSYRVRADRAGCSPAYSLPITFYTEPKGGTITSSNGSQNACMTSNALLNVTGHVGTILQWEYSTDNNNWSALADSEGRQQYSDVRTAPVNYYRVKASLNNCPPAYSPSFRIDVNATTKPGIIRVREDADAEMVNGVLTFHPTFYRTGDKNGAVENWWKRTDAAGTVAVAGTSDEITATLTQTAGYRAQVKSGVCDALLSGEAIFVVNRPRVGTQRVLEHELVVSYTGVDYVVNSMDGVSLANGFSFSANSAQGFFVLMDDNYDTPPADQNFVLEETILEEGLTTESEVYFANANQRQSRYQYSDDLGRPIQNVSRRMSPQEKDIITPITYDAVGRPDKEYLPYVAETNDGHFRKNAIQEQSAFYLSPPEKTASSSFPFAVRIYEPSPLERVTEQGAFGADWQPVTGHTTKFIHLVNDGEEVMRWTIDATSTLPIPNGYYPSGQLQAQVVTSENDHITKEYVDKQNLTVLKRVQNNNTWLDTYYIYDAFNRLRYVIQPEGIVQLTGNPDQDFMDRWAFQYTYDQRGRMIEKKLPGVDKVSMVYDNRDRLVLTQNGVQQEKNQWVFTKYDNFNRPVMTGIYTYADPNNPSRIASRSDISGWVSTTEFNEQVSLTTPYGYTTNRVFPTENMEVLTITYYDQYGFKSLFGAGQFDYDPAALEGMKAQAYDKTISLVTGKQSRVLGTDQWLKTVNYYDNRYRLTQSISSHHLGGTERLSFNYDFTGNITSKSIIHKKGTETHTILEQFTYDHAARLLTHHHKIGNGPLIQLVQNAYNENGQRVEKNLHHKDNTYLQSVDYRYNIRGWLTHINNSVLENDGGLTNDDSNDFFGMELGYNNDLDVGPTTPQFNGNISSVKWSAGLGLGEGSIDMPTERAYTFTYDPVDRLQEASHAFKIGSWISTSAFQESYRYDSNGNLLGLKRNDVSGVPIDWLEYNYGEGAAKSNQLLAVTDLSITTKSFRDKNKTGNDYAYDANGNIVKDLNKGFDTLVYNGYLNFTEEIVQDNGGKIKYIHNADGLKLAEEVYESGSTTPARRTDFVSGMTYVDGKLQSVVHNEGQIIIPGENDPDQSPEYQYQIKDHQNNIRLTFTAKEKVFEYKATMEDTGIPDMNNPRVSEMAYFENLFETEIRNVSQWLNHTSPAQGNAIYLDGSEDRTLGPYTILKVSPGDVVKMEVYGKFENKESHSSMDLGVLLGMLVNPAATGLAAESGTLLSQGEVGGMLGVFLDDKINENTKPAGDLNYILFDKDLNIVDFDYDRIDEAAGFNTLGENSVDFDTLYLEKVIDRVGYIFIYVSNESPGSRVWLDDLTITHQYSPVIQFEDYYPFGLSMNGTAYERGNETYKGKITAEGTGLKDLGFRQYDPVLGKFHAVDPLAEIQLQESPYQYAGNNPVNQIDLLGLEGEEASEEGASSLSLTGKYKQPKEKRGYSKWREDRKKAREERRLKKAAEREKREKDKKTTSTNNTGGTSGGSTITTTTSTILDGKNTIPPGIEGELESARLDFLKYVKSTRNVSLLSADEGLAIGSIDPLQQRSLFSDQVMLNASDPALRKATMPAITPLHRPEIHSKLPIATAYDQATKMPRELYREHLYSTLPITEARALEQRALVWSAPFPNSGYPNSLQANADVTNNSSRSDDEILDQEDQPLTRQQLRTDPRYAPLTTQSLRDKAQQACPGCAEYQRNIVAGNALEYAWSYWSGKPRNRFKNFINDVRSQRVRPDFVYSKFEYGTNEDTGKPDVWEYDNGVFVEVKASQNEINLNSFKKQIWGELNALSKQKGSEVSDWTFGIGGKQAEDGVLSFCLVVTEDTEINLDIINEATQLGLTVFVAYAYENVATGGVVFSIPERKNFLELEGVHVILLPEQPSEGIQLDWDRAIPSWQLSNEYDESQP